MRAYGQQEFFKEFFEINLFEMSYEILRFIEGC
jgi:hypothetical protein